jgi:hypothetical protein
VRSESTNDNKEESVVVATSNRDHVKGINESRRGPTNATGAAELNIGTNQKSVGVGGTDKRPCEKISSRVHGSPIKWTTSHAKSELSESIVRGSRNCQEPREEMSRVRGSQKNRTRHANE